MTRSAESILLVDADPHFSEAMVRRLARTGWAAHAVQGGEAAWGWIARRRPDLLVLDVRLGDMGAGQLIDRLDEEGLATEFVILSGFGDERTAVEMMKRGARDYLLKDAAVFERLPLVVRQVFDRIGRERRLAAAERSLRLLETAVSHAQDGIAVLSAEPEPRILYANPNFREAAQAAQQPPQRASFDYLHGLPAEEVLPRLCRGEVLQRRVVREPPGQPSLIIDSALTPVQGEQGEVESFIAVQRDISRSARLEERVRQAQKLEAVGQLAGGVAHDFNNLLTVILGHTGLILQGEGLAAGARDSAERIQQAALNGAQLVTQLLTFSRRQRLHPQIIDLNEVVRDLARMLRHTLGQQRRLLDALHPAPLPVHVDPAQLQSVLLNLALNARDATPEGGMLRIRTEETALPGDLLLDPPARRFACLQVEDDGMGMPPEVQARIFEPFFTTKGPGKGTGLGLSTVYAIIQQSGGLIQVRSAPRQGSCFTIYLPIVSHPPAPAPAASPRQTILLAEDDALVRQLVRLILERAGYHVLEANTGLLAQRLLLEHPDPIDLLITDLRMPDLDGHRLAREARRRHPGLPILLISGLTPPDTAAAELPILHKPFTAQQLLQHIQALLPG